MSQSGGAAAAVVGLSVDEIIEERGKREGKALSYAAVGMNHE
jgi:hypothetical protein